MLKTEKGLKAEKRETSKLTEVLERTETMEMLEKLLKEVKEVNKGISEIADDLEITEKGDEMLRAYETAIIEDKETIAKWNGTMEKEIAERTEKAAKAANGYASDEPEITEKGDEMETGKAKVKMVKGVVSEWFEESENQDGTEIWEGMSVDEMLEDLAIWVNEHRTDITYEK